MTIIILSGFVLSVLAPWVSKYAGHRAGWFLALLPAAWTAYFLGTVSDISYGRAFFEQTSWVPKLGIHFSFYLDGLSLLFSLLISGIGALVVVYSGGYLAKHAQIGRFYSFLIFFMTSMLGVILSDNVITLFIFWELTSFSSYLLIGFNHKRPEARSAALQALIVTGIGGLAMLAGLILLGMVGGGFEFSALMREKSVVQAHPLYIPILLLILSGAFTKSSQFPFHFWLPNAMQAPTPVSAYLHSSTMVKAGIYLLARLMPVLGGTQAWQQLLIFFGGATMLVASILLVRKTAAKGLLAYSTVSVLGFLTVLIGLGTDAAIHAALVFLLAHAFYKGALFLVAGALDHGTGVRDTEQLGGLGRAMPMTAVAAFLAALSMAGLPPLLGFIAKEGVYEAVSLGPFWILLFAFSSMLFVVAAWLCGIKPFIGKKRPIKAHAESINLWLGPLVLAGLGLSLGVSPDWVGHTILAPGAGAILGQPVESHLALWHGWSPILLLSAAVLLGGLGMVAARKQIRECLLKVGILFQWGPEYWYEKGLKGIIKFAEHETRFFQNGYLRRYLLAILTTLIFLIGVTFLSRGQSLVRPLTWDMSLYEMGLTLLILAATFFAVRSHSRLGAVVALGVVGYGVALLFLHLGAPDLAMTQLVVDTIAVILFVLVLHHLPHFAMYSGRGARFGDAVIAVVAGGIMTLLVVWATVLPLNLSLTDYFAANSVSLAHGRNIVNVILVDFRSLDTLGEITVLVIAGLGIFGMLKLRLPEQKLKKGN